MLQYYYLIRRYQINNLARWCQFFGVWGVGRILQNQNSYVIILHNFIRYRSVQLDLMSMTVWPCVQLPLKKHQRKTLLILHRKISRFLTFLPQNYCEFYGNRNINETKFNETKFKYLHRQSNIVEAVTGKPCKLPQNHQTQSKWRIFDRWIDLEWSQVLKLSGSRFYFQKTGFWPENRPFFHVFWTFSGVPSVGILRKLSQILNKMCRTN